MYNKAVLNIATARLIEELGRILHSIELSSAFSHKMPEIHTTVKQLIEMIEKCSCGDDVSALSTTIDEFGNRVKSSVEGECADILDTTDAISKKLLASMHYRSQNDLKREVDKLHTCTRTFVLAIQGNNCKDRVRSMLIDTINTDLDALFDWVWNHTRYQGGLLKLIISNLKFAMTSKNNKEIICCIEAIDDCFENDLAFARDTKTIDRHMSIIKKYTAYLIDVNSDYNEIAAKLSAAEERIAQLEAKLNNISTLSEI